MADDSELDYIRTFLGKVHTAATVKGVHEATRLAHINDTQRMLVHNGELIGSPYPHLITKKYRVEIEETSEANLSTALDNIVEGIRKLNFRETITDYTRPEDLNNIKLSPEKGQISNALSGKWYTTIYLIITWVT